MKKKNKYKGKKYKKPLDSFLNKNTNLDNGETVSKAYKSIMKYFNGGTVDDDYTIEPEPELDLEEQKELAKGEKKISKALNNSNFMKGDFMQNIGMMAAGATFDMSSAAVQKLMDMAMGGGDAFEGLRPNFNNVTQVVAKGGKVKGDPIKKLGKFTATVTPQDQKFLTRMQKKYGDEAMKEAGKYFMMPGEYDLGIEGVQDDAYFKSQNFASPEGYTDKTYKNPKYFASTVDVKYPQIFDKDFNPSYTVDEEAKSIGIKPYNRKQMRQFFKRYANGGMVEVEADNTSTEQIIPKFKLGSAVEPNKKSNFKMPVGKITSLDNLLNNRENILGNNKENIFNTRLGMGDVNSGFDYTIPKTNIGFSGNLNQPILPIFEGNLPTPTGNLEARFSNKDNALSFTTGLETDFINSPTGFGRLNYNPSDKFSASGGVKGQDGNLSGDLSLNYMGDKFSTGLNLNTNKEGFDIGGDLNYQIRPGTSIGADFKYGKNEQGNYEPTANLTYRSDMQKPMKKQPKKLFKNGGLVEVEGGEAFETPNGQVGEFVGPDHSEGGIKMQVGDENSNITNDIVPEGTEVYSKQIKKDGKNMAQRKLEREKYIKSLEDKLEENSNPLLEATYNRARETMAIADSADKRIQEEVRAMENLDGISKYLAKYGGKMKREMYGYGGKMKYNNGGGIKDPTKLTDDEQINVPQMQSLVFNQQPIPKMPLFNLSTNQIQPIDLGINVPKSVYMDDFPIEQEPDEVTKTIPEAEEMYNSDPYNFPLEQEPDEEPTKTISFPTKEKAMADDMTKRAMQGYDFTIGDYLGLAGVGISGLGPLSTTIANRLTDRPNINFYRDFGQDTLAKLEGQKGFLGQQFKQQEAQIGEFARNATRRYQNTARSVNQARAMGQMSDMQANDMLQKAYTNYAQQMLGVESQIAQTTLQAEKAFAAGETARDKAGREDRDAFFTNLNKDLVNLGTAMQAGAKALNVKELDQQINKIMPMLSRFGISIRKDGKGGYEFYSTATNQTQTTEQVKANLDKAKQEAAEKAEKDKKTNKTSK